METVKIALFGKMRSGKDTVANLLEEKLPFERYAFGEAIGEIIDIYFPTARKQGKPRKHYQVIGQAFRQLDEDVWVDYLLATVNHAIEQQHKRSQMACVLVTDGRQENEARRLKEEGFVIVKVECDEVERLRRIKQENDNFDPAQLNHETELQVDKIQADYVIKNNEGMNELKKQVDLLVALVLLDQVMDNDLAYLAGMVERYES